MGEVILLSELFGVEFLMGPGSNLLKSVLGKNIKVRVLDADDSGFEVGSDCEGHFFFIQGLLSTDHLTRSRISNFKFDFKGIISMV